MGVKNCEYVSVLEIAQYICKEIQSNSKTRDVRMIRGLLSSYNRNKKEAHKALGSMTLIGQALLLSNPQNSPLLSAAISDKIEGRKKAYQKWKRLVGAGCPWDHKAKILELQGNKGWSCDKNKHFLFFYDLWSNIHYGFIGKLAGFTEWELLNGAGYAQLNDNSRNWKEWALQYARNRVREFGDADILAAFDDASDNEAIKIGFKLHNRFGTAPSSLTAQAIIEEVYKSIDEHKPISVIKCQDH